jgi:hypothetical protein
MGTLEDSVRKAAGTPVARDAATRDLALTYARAIDNGGDLTKLGPALLSTLEALQLSPRARKAVTPIAGQPKLNPLDEIAERRRRKRDAPAVDTGTP